MALLLELTTTQLLYSIITCLVVTYLLSKWLRERKYPPGPMGIPVLGFTPFLGKTPHKKLRELSKKYGDIFSFYLGSEINVCVTDYHLLKDLITNPSLLLRNPRQFDFIVGKGGFLGMNGEEWQEQRRFAFHTMRNLGLGRGQWETLIQENVVDLIAEINSWKGAPTDIETTITNTQSSTTISLLFGRHLDEKKDAESLQIIRSSAREFLQYLSAVSITVSIFWLRKIMEIFHLGGYDRFFELLNQFQDIFIKEVEGRMKDPDSWEKDDFIGCYLKEWQKRDKETKNHNFNKLSLMGNLFALFIGGNDTTIASSYWIFLIMAHNQEGQKKIHEEIDSVIGRDGAVSYDDRGKFPYTMATILEMTRWISIVPLLPGRMAAEDVKCGDYIIPKGAQVIGNVWSIHHDTRYFENPNEFSPERFMDKDGTKASAKLDGYAVFSLGKRNCPGEGVAIMTLFLYFVSLMQKFQVKMPPGKTADFEPVFGGVVLPKPQEICFVPR